MRKEKVSANIDKNLRKAADAKANQLGISRAKLIEIALESELGRFNVHKENKRLTEAKVRSEQETEALRQQRTTAESEHTETRDRLEREKNQLTAQRDEFEKLLHEETDAYNKCYERAESLKKERATAQEHLKQVASHLGVPDTAKHCTQRIDELQASIENKEKERDTFKAKFEKVSEACSTCSEKLTLLQERNWWDRLWNKIPWVTEVSLPIDENRDWDTPSAPITPTPTDPDDTGE